VVKQWDVHNTLLFVVQAFIDTLKTNIPSAEFCYFPEHKNGNLKSLNGRLTGQPTASKGSSRLGKSSFNNPRPLQKFGLTMHVGDQRNKSKTEGMFFPKSFKDANKQRKERTTPSNINLPNEKCIHFTEHFKYLGSLISLELNEDAEITFRINKAKSLMGILHHFFSCCNIDLRTKYNIYVTCPLNALLWGCETWNSSAKN
jgi:hypothetical protein